MKTEIENMTRWEVINALRPHAHPSWYHQLLAWKTRELKALLYYYELPEESEQVEIIIRVKRTKGKMLF